MMSKQLYDAWGTEFTAEEIMEAWINEINYHPYLRGSFKKSNIRLHWRKLAAKKSYHFFDGQVFRGDEPCSNTGYAIEFTKIIARAIIAPLSK